MQEEKPLDWCYWHGKKLSECAAEHTIDLFSHEYCPGYEKAVGELMIALDKILAGRDDGRRDDGIGVCNEPWESRRRRLIALVKSNINRGGDYL